MVLLSPRCFPLLSPVSPGRRPVPASGRSQAGCQAAPACPWAQVVTADRICVRTCHLCRRTSHGRQGKPPTYLPTLRPCQGMHRPALLSTLRPFHPPKPPDLARAPITTVFTCSPLGKPIRAYPYSWTSWLQGEPGELEETQVEILILCNADRLPGEPAG